MTLKSIARLSDSDLIAQTKSTALRERETTVELIGLLAEVDVRRLYLAEGYASMFTYCTDVLNLSEPAAYTRIAAARAARRYPRILAMLEQGNLTLATTVLLAPHLSSGNADVLLNAAHGASKRTVERMLAGALPQPDVAASVRKLPVRRAALVVSPAPMLAMDPPVALGAATVAAGPAPKAPPASPPSGQTAAASAGKPMPSTLDLLGSQSARVRSELSRQWLVAPLAPGRHLLRVTIADATRDKLERAQSMLRHVIPGGDLATVLDRALTLLVDHLERRRLGAPAKPVANARKRAPGRGEKTVRDLTPGQPGGKRSRRIPIKIRQVVWARDTGRCAFVGSNGRCAETNFLEFHHVVPFAVGGANSVDNLQLRCRAHNQYEADQYFGPG